MTRVTRSSAPFHLHCLNLPAAHRRGTTATSDFFRRRRLLQTCRYAGRRFDTVNQMQRICFVLQVKPDLLAEYRERHANVWPEMRDALSAAGWHNYSLFLRDDGMLIGYVETADFQKALQAMASTEVNTRWQRE